MALLEWLASKPEINLFSSFIYTALKKIILLKLITKFFSLLVALL